MILYGQIQRLNEIDALAILWRVPVPIPGVPGAMQPLAEFAAAAIRERDIAHCRTTHMVVPRAYEAFAHFLGLDTTSLMLFGLTTEWGDAVSFRGESP